MYNLPKVSTFTNLRALNSIALIRLYFFTITFSCSHYITYHAQIINKGPEF